jgi:hypothetical protein
VIDRVVLPALILLLMHFFLVSKGDVDICMVYDGSKSGLNAAIWAPWFCTVLPGYWCADNDYSEMFLDFPLHEGLQKYCGVDFLVSDHRQITERK